MRTVDANSATELVVSFRQLDANLDYLDERRFASDPALGSRYAGFIERGTVFLPYLSVGVIAFAPSRFLGYVNNTFEKHALYEDKDGSQTTPALSLVLENEARQHAGLEQEYLIFCVAIGAKPGGTGRFGKPRRYWQPYRSERVLKERLK